MDTEIDPDACGVYYEGSDRYLPCVREKGHEGCCVGGVER